ncbi:MAG: hypothetical protein P4L46_01160 [Fimbriimonas sp.]|nr:hypothetical protein [Fimbriimonas sp.]
MRILVFEDNLLWSSRFVRTLKVLGHEPVVTTSIPEGSLSGTVAIVNLGSTNMRPQELVPQLRERGAHVIGHAGHREKEILELGRSAGCDRVATNSEITFKIEALLDSLTGKSENSSESY